VRVVDGNTGQWHDVPLAQHPSGGGESVVTIALGTIESTRLALLTFKDSLAGRAAARMGKNQMAHLRSNLTIRIPRSAFPGLPAAIRSLQTSALLVKGKANIRGTDRYFHLQITASGLSPMGTDSEAELFKKIPDLDQIDKLLQADDQSVVVTIRGIGEMAPQNPDSKVELARFDSDAWGRPLAWVEIGDARAATGGSQQTQDDRALWEAMDNAADEVAVILANGHPFEILNAEGGQTIPVAAGATPAQLKGLHPHDADSGRWDFLGTTHHEAGTLWMSDNPATGVTNEFGRIHDTTNCYVVGPALCPTSGSPNPRLTGVALGRRAAGACAAAAAGRESRAASSKQENGLYGGIRVMVGRCVARARLTPGPPSRAGAPGESRNRRGPLALAPLRALGHGHALAVGLR
jgi:hypothetical protein